MINCDHAMNITLNSLKDRFFDFKEKEPFFSSGKKTTAQFVKLFFPPEFTEELPFKSSFHHYPTSYNATTSKIFNGKGISKTLKKAIIGFFSSDESRWSAEIDRCSALINQNCKSRSQLQEYLENTVFEDIDHFLSASNRTRIRSLCRSDLGQALAIAVFYVLMQGDIQFLMDLSMYKSIHFVISPLCLGYIKKNIRKACEDPETFDTLYGRYSDLFSRISIQEAMGDPPMPERCFLDNLLNQILDSNGNYALKIIGATGTEKNAISQLLFLRMASHKGGSRYFPFYISIHKIIKQLKAQANYLDMTLIPEIKDYLHICEQNPSLIPVVFVDDLVAYDWGNEGSPTVLHLDYYLSDLFQFHSVADRIKYVISIDQGFPENTGRNREHIPFDSSSYKIVIKTQSIATDNEELLLSVLGLVDQIYGICDHDIHSYYRKIRQFGFAALDLYQIRFLNRALCHKKDFNKITDIFQFEFQRRLHVSSSELAETAKYAYQFAYGSIPVEENRSTANVRELMYHHKCFVEYLIAHYYLNSLASPNGIEDIHNIVLPKEITFFIVNILNNDSFVAQNIIRFCNRSYQKLSVHGRSQIAYLLGRIRLPEFCDEALCRLMDLYDAETAVLAHARGSLSDIDRRRQLFLIRSLSVSLIYRGRKEIAKQYLCGLLMDDCANDINRGFHLEYYGDITYNPSLLILSYSDNVSVGHRAMTQLLNILGSSTASGMEKTIFELNLFSLCSLLQARMFQNGTETMDVRPVAQKASVILEKYIAHNAFICEKLKFYFRFMHKELQRLLNSEDSCYDDASTRLFNTLFEAQKILRKGWVKRGIPNPENIVEHTYTAWQIGLLFLPQHYQDPTYSKQKVLNMLLVHDLGEVVVDDATPLDDSAARRSEENEVMCHFFLTGTYPQNANLDTYYELWNEWYSQFSLSARVAKDLDEIQCCYQLCIYHMCYPELLSVNDVNEWIQSYRLRTNIGKEIMEKLIYGNSAFRVIFA